MTTDVVHLPEPQLKTVERIETQIEAARAELGNAGFASAVGEIGLSLDALAIVTQHVEDTTGKAQTAF